METSPSPPPSHSPRPRYGAWLRALADAPHRHDFYQVLRHVESAHPWLPRLGQALRPADEPLRVAQSSALGFAPAPLQQLVFPPQGMPRLVQRIFGLLGPNGPLPLHLTALAHDRSHQAGDDGLQRFLDTLTHRFALLFYRAWAQAQPALDLDRPGDDAGARRLGALLGIGSPALQQRDAAGDAAKLHFSGRLARHVRDADGLENWCRSEFGTPVRVRQWRGRWMPLAGRERTRLARRGGPGLGVGAVLGAAVWDVQHGMRIAIGPLPLARYLGFLPGARDLARLHAMVRQWVGLEFDWDLQLLLAAGDVPRLHLGRGSALGRSAWLGRYGRPGPAGDLVIDVERCLRQRPRPAAARGEDNHG